MIELVMLTFKVLIVMDLYDAKIIMIMLTSQNHENLEKKRDSKKSILLKTYSAVATKILNSYSGEKLFPR